MYKIIGSDQREYGPISGDQLRQWIAEGRVGPQTMVQSDADPNWRPLNSFAEFAASFATAPPGLAGQFAGTDMRAQALAAVQGPAICLMITAGLGIALALLGMVLTMAGMVPMRASGSGDPEMDRMVMFFAGSFAMIFRVIGIAVGVFILYGAMKMKRLEKYGLSMTATILAMIPCISPCCLLGLPFGIWAVVVLGRPEVKSSFT